MPAGLAKAGGAPFAELVRDQVIGPIEAATLAFGPREPARCAATEGDEALGRGRVRGAVHDENAAAVGGFRPHPRLFCTAAHVTAIALIFPGGPVLRNYLATPALH